jgi:tetratricopeptide (TPR) repeat protein
MKKIAYSLAVGVFIVSACLLDGQEPPSEVPADFLKRIREAAEAIGSEKYEEAHRALDQADAILSDHRTSQELRAIVYMRTNKPKEAEKIYTKQFKANPKNSVILFNRAEARFMDKNYQSAIKDLKEYLGTQQVPGNALVRFKLFLSYLMMDNRKEMEASIEDAQPTISHPLYYYTQAALAFHKGDTGKGEDFVKSAFEIYPFALNSGFYNAIVEMGWLKKENLINEFGGTVPVTLDTMDQKTFDLLNQEFRPNTDIPSEGLIDFEGLLPPVEGN